MIQHTLRMINIRSGNMSRTKYDLNAYRKQSRWHSYNSRIPVQLGREYDSHQLAIYLLVLYVFL